MRTRLLVVPSLLALIGCRAHTDAAGERVAILHADQEWANAAASKDVERTVSFWAEDAVVFPPDQPAIRGKDSIRAYVLASFKMPGFAVRWQTTELTVSPGGDLAYGSGTNVVTLNGPDGKPVTLAGKAVTVWRKGSDGDWKCVVDIWNR